MDELLQSLQREYPEVNFQLINNNIVAHVQRFQYGMLTIDEHGKTIINDAAAKAARRMQMFYNCEDALVERGHRGKFAAINDDGRILLFRTSNEAYKKCDIRQFFVSQVGCAGEF